MMKKARIKRVIVNPNVLFHVFGSRTAWKVVEGIPVGATMKGFTVDPLTMNLNLFIAHESFPEIQLEFEVADSLNMLFEKI